MTTAACGLNRLPPGSRAAPQGRRRRQVWYCYAVRCERYGHGGIGVLSCSNGIRRARTAVSSSPGNAAGFRSENSCLSFPQWSSFTCRAKPRSHRTALNGDRCPLGRVGALRFVRRTIHTTAAPSLPAVISIAARRVAALKPKRRIDGRRGHAVLSRSSLAVTASRRYPLTPHAPPQTDLCARACLRVRGHMRS